MSKKILVFTLLFGVFLSLGLTAQAATSSLTAAETVANSAVGTDDQTATLASSTPNVAEVKASTTLTVATPPIDTETIIIGGCTVTFQVVASSSATCVGNTANIDVGDGNNAKTAAQVATELLNLTMINATTTGTIYSLDTVVGSTTVTVGFVTSASTTDVGGPITFTDGTTGKIVWNDERAGVAPVAEIDQITIAGTVDTGDTFGLTTSSTTYSYTVLAGATTLRLIVDGLYYVFQNAAGSSTESFTVSTTTGGKLVVTASTAGTGNTVSAATPTNYAGVAQVITFTPATITSGDVFKMSINGRDYSYTAGGSDTVAVVVAGLVAAAADDPVATCSNTTTEVTCTAKTTGTAFTSYAGLVTAATVTGGSYSGGGGGAPTVVPASEASMIQALQTKINTLLVTLRALQAQRGIAQQGSSVSTFGQQVRAIVTDLDIGNRGNNVSVLQQFLISQDIGSAAKALAEVGATSYFGELTRSALAEFQAKAGIKPAVGYFGPVTRAYINSH